MSFGMRVFCRSAKDREAGETPALPRNCKRGNCSPVTRKPGKAGCICRMLITSSLASQETGADRLPYPLSRAKEDGMRILRVVFFIFAFVAAASAAELKRKVVDLQSDALPGTEVPRL